MKLCIHAASLPHFDSIPFSKLGPTGLTQDGGAAVETQRLGGTKEEKKIGKIRGRHGKT